MLHFKSFGSGNPVIILHGLFGSLDNWQTVARALAEEHLVYIVDQRNHGRSPHFDDMDYQLLAEDLKEFMEENWIHRSSLIGHSMGGKTAMGFALEYPELVDKLIVVDMAPRKYAPGHDQIFAALRSVQVASLHSRNELDEHLKKDIQDDAVRLFLMKNLVREKGGDYRWKMNLESLFQNYENILAEIQSDHIFEGASLFVAGALSGYITEEEEPMIKALFPAARVEVVKGAGHWVHAEKRDEFISLCQHFLSSDNP